MSSSPPSRPAASPARAVEPSSDPRQSTKPSQPSATSPAKANTPAPAAAADDKKKDDPAATPTARPDTDDAKKASDSASSKPVGKADASKDARPASPAAKDGSPPSATPRVDAAASPPPPAAALPGQPAPPPPSPAADASAAATPAQAQPAPQQACTKATDCQSKICLAGFCATSSGFALATAPALPGTTTATLRNGRTVTLRATSGALVDSQGRTYRAASGSGASGAHQTACSDPRCVLPADLVGLQEVDDLSGAPPGGRDVLSDAAIAGIVLALLFVVLFLLLVVPKVRDVLGDRIAQWRNRKDERKQRELRDASTPDFGNEDASAFEKGFTPSASPAGELRGHGFAAASADGQQHGSTTIDIGDPEKAGIAWQQHNQPQPTPIYHSTTQHYQRDEVTSFTGAGARRKAISFAADLPCARPAGVETRAGGQKKVSPTSQQPRETVLPYTVAGEDEEQRSALMDLRTIASPAMPANHALANPFKTPTMPSAAAFPAPPGQASFFSTPESNLRSPATPGSAYSTGTAALPASLQAGGGLGMGFGRLPINSHARRPTNIPQRPGLQRLPSVKVTPSSMQMASEMEWIASGRRGSPATSPQR